MNNRNIVFEADTISTMVIGTGDANIQQNYQPLAIVPIQNTRGINQAYLRPLPQVILQPGQKESQWTLLVQNEMRDGTRSYEDSETWRLRYAFRISTQNGEWRVSIPLIHRGGGIFDPFINWWHNTVVAHRAPERESTPQNQYSVHLPDGTSVRSGTGLGDVNLSYAFRLPGQPEIGIKLPMGNPNQLLGSGGVDLSFSALRSIPVSKNINFTIYGSLVYQSPSSLWKGTKPFSTNYSAALQYKTSPTQAWILQYTSETAPIKNHNLYLDSPNAIVTIAHSQITKSGLWTFWLSEDGDIGKFNINQNVNVGADFAIGITFTQFK